MPSLRHSFTVPGAPADVFSVLADPARVVGCLPGAELDGDAPARLEAGQELGGRIAVKLGPVATSFRGAIRVLELDREARRSVLGVRAEDERGNGSTSATIELAVEPDGPGSRVDLHAEIEVRGRVATFGAAVVDRVSARLLDRFAANLADVLAGRRPAQPPAPPPRPEAPDRVSAGPPVWPVLATVWAFLAGWLLGRARAAR